MRVMIVEDEALIAFDLEDIVAGLGYDVCATAASAPEAIDAARNHSPDIALMDIRLARGTSGIDAAREIYNSHNVRCIYLSGNLDPATLRTLEAFEPLAFLGKPVLPALLHRALAKAAELFAEKGS